jgi:hypothetical protein
LHIFLEPLLGAIVWVAANVIYVDLRRKGRRKGRWVAFFAGYPGTLVSMFVVREGTIPQIEPPPDDEDRLLREIRVDRGLREGGERQEALGGGEREEPPVN